MPRRGILLAGSAAAASFLGVAASDLRGPAVDRAAKMILAPALRAHTTFLADDRLEGRGTGTRGHEIAARYVAAQFELIGLAPGTAGGWFQNVPLRRSELDSKSTRLDLVRPGAGRAELVLGRHAIVPGDFRETTEVEATVLFVGYGIQAPTLRRDDYAGADATGKLVAFLPGAPSEWSTDERSYYGQPSRKEAAAVSHGAVGVLQLSSRGEKPGDWDLVLRSLARAPTLAWLEDGSPEGFRPELRGRAWLGPQASEALFAGSPVSYDAASSGAVPAELAARVHLLEKSRLTNVDSPNVVGLVRGSDPRLRDEYVVITAHLDHLGIGEPVDGDAIYNGAVDNASGVAALIEIARAFVSLPDRPRRSILFVALTGEEPGLLGSDYFVRHPPIPRGAIAADVNIDGASVWPFEGLVPRGAEHSTLGGLMEDALAAAGTRVSPDPQAGQALLAGSDQYSFLKAGIPSVVFGAARTPEARALALDWVRHRYHAPSDDLSQPLDFDAAANFSRAVFRVAFAIAQDEARPKWNPGDFFERLSAPSSARE